MCGEDNFRHIIVGLWTETVGFGIVIFLYCGSISAIYSGKRERKTLLYFISSVIFAMCTMSWVLQICATIPIRLVVCDFACTGSYCVPCGAQPAETLTKESNFNDLVLALSDFPILIAGFTASAMMIWRCFVVWDFTYWVILVPAIALVINTGAGIWVLYLVLQVYLISDHAPASLTTPPERWVQDLLTENTLNTVTNILPVFIDTLTTIMIIGRIWYITRASSVRTSTSPGSGQVYNHVITSLIESQALLFIIYILQLVGSYTNLYLANISQALLNQVLGMAPLLLIAQLAFSPKAEVNTVLYDTLGNVQTIDRDITFASRGSKEPEDISGAGEIPEMPVE